MEKLSNVILIIVPTFEKKTEYLCSVWFFYSVNFRQSK